MNQDNAYGGSSCGWGKKEQWLVVALTAAALLIRLFRLDYRGMWTDEFHTLNAALLPWDNLISERLRAGHLPTYFLFMKLWTSAFGTSDFVLRLPSALVGCLIVPATVYFARPWLQPKLVWCLAAAAAVNGTAVWAAQEARMYSMLLVAATWAHGAFARAVLGQAHRDWICYVLAAFFAVALQPVMIVWIAAHGVCAYTLQKGRPTFLRGWLIALFATLPLLVLVATVQEKRAVAFDSHSLSDFVRDIVRNGGIFLKRLGLVAFGVSADSGQWRALTSVVLAICLAFAGWEWRRRRATDALFCGSKEAVFLKFCTLIVFIPAAILFIASFLMDHIAGNERYLIPLCAPLWSLAIWGFTAPLGQRLRDALVVVAVALLATGLIRHWRDRGLGGREIVYFINRHALPGDTIVCRATPTMKRMVEHYSYRPLTVCTVPEPTDRYDIGRNEAYEALLSCLRGRKRFWLVEYRGKGSFLRQVISQHPHEFEVLKEVSIEQTRCALVKCRILD
ncbi:MAG: hypothetical protein N2Z21_10395 [Candidatus Sumerlaeaceae bacterium]|nr:hypothetical protein [Candidatus Sumerlaeaceae bacterium]